MKPSLSYWPAVNKSNNQLIIKSINNLSLHTSSTDHFSHFDLLLCTGPASSVDQVLNYLQVWLLNFLTKFKEYTKL